MNALEYLHVPHRLHTRPRHTIIVDELTAR